MADRPLPRIDEESRGYWEAARRHELLLQRCRACGAFCHHPRAVCPECLSSDIDWVVSPGRGEIYTFTVTYQNQSPGFAGRVPYVLAYVLLEEGIQILTNIVDVSPEEVRIGQAVEVCFEDLSEEISIPTFRVL